MGISCCPYKIGKLTKVVESPHISSMLILVISWPWASFGPEIDEEITFAVHLNKTEGRTLELFIREHCLAKKVLNSSALSSCLLISFLMKQWQDAGHLFIIEKWLENLPVCLSTGQWIHHSFRDTWIIHFFVSFN